MAIKLTRRPRSKTPPPLKPKTLGEVIERLKQAPGLAAGKRSDLISGCNATARIVSLPPESVMANAPTIRNIFATATPGTANLSIKRFDNVRGLVIAACQKTGAISPMPPTSARSQAWKDFLGKSQKSHNAYNLARFAGFCSQRNIGPEKVCDMILADFADFLDVRLVTQAPSKVIEHTRHGFNAIAKEIGIKPRLNAPPRKAYRSAPLSSYPAALQEEITAYLASLQASDHFADIGVGRELCDVSIANTKQHLLQLLDAAVRSGIPRETLTGLSVLIVKSTWAPAFEVIRERIGKKYPASLTLITRSLLVMAQHYLDAPAPVIDDLKLAKKKISEGNGLDFFQMGARSKAIMAQFDKQANVRRILHLPQKLLKLAPTRRRKCETELDAMAAAAIAILLNSPLRMKNLSEARLGKEIIRRPGNKGRCTFDVRFLAPNTKNKLAIDAVISGKSAAILDQYIRKFRPTQVEGGTDALFPDASGKPREPGKFGAMISGRILKHTGLRMTPHCFRHLAAKIILDNDPGAVRKAQQVLNHKKITTTTSFYCDPNSEAAFRDYHDLLDKLWDE